MIHAAVISFIINQDIILSSDSICLWNYALNSKSSQYLSSYHVMVMQPRLDLIQSLKVMSFPILLSQLIKLKNFHLSCLFGHFAYLKIMIQGHAGLFGYTFDHQIDKAHINLHKYLQAMDFQSKYYSFFKSVVIYFEYDLLLYFL